jgi:hypothetical protein
MDNNNNKNKKEIREELDLNEEDLHLLEDDNLRKRKISNKINSFLNSNFQYVSIIVIAVVFWFSFSYIFVPKYEMIVRDSTEILQEKKEGFVREYRVLADNKESVKTYSQIDESDIDKIMKIVPEEYTKDYLFTWFTYFLMKNNYNVRSVKITDINEVNKKVEEQTTIEGSTLGESRRGAEETESTSTSTRSNLSYAPNHFNSLSYDISSSLGAWVIKTEISGVTYFDLKYLVDIIENNLKIIDIVSLDFNPASRVVEMEAVSYYKKK